MNLLLSAIEHLCAVTPVLIKIIFELKIKGKYCFAVIIIPQNTFCFYIAKYSLRNCLLLSCNVLRG